MDELSFILSDGGVNVNGEGVGHSILASAGLRMGLEGRNAEATTLAETALATSEKASFEYGTFLANNVKDIIARQGGGEDSGGGDGGLEVDPEMLKMKINDVANSLMGIESLAGDTPLMDAGLDSLSMVEFRNELVKEFPGVDLPGALLFDYPTVNSWLSSSGRVSRGPRL